MPSSSATVFAKAVFPTPVGPTNKKQAAGFSFALNPARDLFTALVRFLTASSCPKIFFERLSSSRFNFSFSLSEIFCSGIFAVFAVILSMSSTCTSGKASRSEPAPLPSAACAARSLSALIFKRAPASSIKSMALSGRSRSRIYRFDSRTAAFNTSSEYRTL